MNRPAFVWLNDAFLPLSQARIPVEDRGFLYGDGFFETLRAEKGVPLFLDEHLHRLRASAREFRLEFPAAFPWEQKIRELLRLNGLQEGSAAVKLILTRGRVEGPGLPPSPSPTLLITARPYSPPPPTEYLQGWPVVVFPEPRTTFIGRHKSLNYLFYLAARQYALDHGAREALVLEADGSLSEAAASNLILCRQSKLYTPAAPSALPGVTLDLLQRTVGQHGYSLERIPLHLSHLEAAEGVWLTNSLLGVMPVSSVNHQQIARHPELTLLLLRCLFPGFQPPQA